MPRPFGSHRIARVKDRRGLELRVLDASDGKNVATLRVKGTGEFGQIGRASATVQNGALAIHGMQTLMLGSARLPGK